MITAANNILRDRTVPESVHVEFKVGRADRLQDLVEDESVDLVVAGPLNTPFFSSHHSD